MTHELFVLENVDQPSLRDYVVLLRASRRWNLVITQTFARNWHWIWDL